MAKRTQFQLHLPEFNRKTQTRAHGGELAIGKRKNARPIDPKQALHVVLRSSQARGTLSLLHPKHCDPIHRFTQKTAKRWGVRLYRYANVGNHIHLLIKVPNRTASQRFLKQLAGGIAQIVTHATKGAALARTKAPTVAESAKRGFWDHLVFTRIVNFGRDFKTLERYLIKNLFESAGISVKKLLARGYQIISLSDAPS